MEMGKQKEMGKLASESRFRTEIVRGNQWCSTRGTLGG